MNLDVELAPRTAAVVKGFNVLRVVTQLLRTDRKRVSYQCCRQSEEVGRDMEGLESALGMKVDLSAKLWEITIRWDLRIV